MASNFPSSLDTFTNPSSTDALDSVSEPHATQHSDLNDAVEALQAKVGVDGSADTGSLDYQLNALNEINTFTPVVKQGTTTFTVTTNEASYYQVNKLVYGVVFVTIASGTGQASQVVTVDLPINTTSVVGSVVGSAWIFDNNTGIGYGGQTVCRTSYVEFVGDWSGGSALGIAPAIQLTTNDQIRFNFCYEVA